jgi:hypothetical protein
VARWLTMPALLGLRGAQNLENAATSGERCLIPVMRAPEAAQKDACRGLAPKPYRKNDVQNIVVESQTPRHARMKASRTPKGRILGIQVFLSGKSTSLLSRDPMASRYSVLRPLRARPPDALLRLQSPLHSAGARAAAEQPVYSSRRPRRMITWWSGLLRFQRSRTRILRVHSTRGDSK